MARVAWLRRDDDLTSRAAEFHPRLIGLTGSKEACAAAARAFRVYYHKTDETKDYLVDHSIIMYLVGALLHLVPELLLCLLTFVSRADPAGEFLAFFGKNVAAPELAGQIAGHMKLWTPQ